MTDRSRLELTDDLIERMVAQRAGSRAPADLVDVVMSATITTSQRRAPLFPAVPRLAMSRPAWVMIAVLLAVLALGAALVGSALLRAPSPVAEGRLMMVSQLGIPEDGSAFGSPTTMHLFAFDEATGTRTPVAELPMKTDSSYSPAIWVKWSPDRTHVLVFNVDGGVLGILDVASRVVTPLDPGDAANGDYQMAWGPTGDRFAWLRTVTDPTTLAISDVTGKEIRHLALPAGMDAGQPSWSPDGTAIALAGCLPCEQGEKGKPPTLVGHGHVFIVPVDGSPIRQLLDVTGGYVNEAAWSPDGASIAASTPDGITTVAVADGRQVAVDRGRDEWPAWSPDGTRIAFTRLDDNETGGRIFVVDVDGAHLTKLTDGLDVKAEWSADGTAIVFGRELSVDVSFSVWIVDAVGGEPRLLFKNATADAGAATTR